MLQMHRILVHACVRSGALAARAACAPAPALSTDAGAGSGAPKPKKSKELKKEDTERKPAKASTRIPVAKKPDPAPKEDPGLESKVSRRAAESLVLGAKDSKSSPKKAATIGKTHNELLSVLLSTKTTTTAPEPSGDKSSVLKMLQSLGVSGVRSQPPTQRPQVAEVMNRNRKRSKDDWQDGRGRDRWGELMQGGERLGIFEPADTQQAAPPPAEDSVWWRYTAEDSYQWSALKPTRNSFEQWIQWTKEGKMWHFPIDNEQDWAEREVPFEDHVFLQDLLEGAFPDSGPLRQFMDLVCLGLSQNPFLTVEQKRAHIVWFQQYFADKLGIVDEAVAESERQRQLEEAEQRAADERARLEQERVHAEEAEKADKISEERRAASASQS